MQSFYPVSRYLSVHSYPGICIPSSSSIHTSAANQQMPHKEKSPDDLIKVKMSCTKCNSNLNASTV